MTKVVAGVVLSNVMNSSTLERYEEQEMTKRTNGGKSLPLLIVERSINVVDLRDAISKRKLVNDGSAFHEAREIVESDKYQLQLRLSDELYAKIEHLTRRSGAETVSETVRWAIREFHSTILRHVTIVLPDGRAINQNGLAAKEELIDTHVAREKTAKRVNVVLRGASYERLKRISALVPELSYGEVIEIAFGILESVMEEEESLVAQYESHPNGGTSGGQKIYKIKGRR